MTHTNSFFNRFIKFVSGNDASNSDNVDREMIQTLDQKLDQLSARLEDHLPTSATSDASNDQSDQSETVVVLKQGVDDLTDQIRKLAKGQFKINTLQESQLAQHEKTLDNFEQLLERQDRQIVELSQHREQAIEAAQLELIKSLLPVLDGLDAAFETGRRQALALSLPREALQAAVGWLDGVRLARLRFLDLLETYNVRQIPTVGHPFDPHYHVAVSTDSSGLMPDGIITEQDLPGYATPDQVLRFAEVVVSRSKK